MAKNSILGVKKYILLGGDIILLYFSLWLTLIIRYQGQFDQALWSKHFLPFSVVFLFWLIIFYIDDLYELGQIRDKANFFSRLIRSMIIGGVLALAFFYLGQNRLFTIRPQRVLIVNIALATVLIYFWHLLLNFFTKAIKITNGLLFIGFNQQVAEIIEQIQQKPQLRLQTKTIIVQENHNIPANLQNITLTNHLADLKNICLEKKINTIISIIHPRQNPELLKSLFACLPLKINFFDLANFYEKITGKIPVTTIEQIWFLENLTENNKKVYDHLKRIFDISFSFLLLVVTLPLVPLVAILVKFSSQGPIFFHQVRTGQAGQNFTLIKFRSMLKDAETQGHQWAKENDPRITKIGRFLRKTRLDEIPQLLNVLKGEMSLVGPRPERPEFIEQLQNEIPFYKERLLVKPGLTGWAQVMGPVYGGSIEESLEKLQYDLYYIKNRSLALDINIFLKTIKIIITKSGR
jgi:exopolysaccharide biosynthesis polyprenyl glycosylphosphotransferase